MRFPGVALSVEAAPARPRMRAESIMALLRRELPKFPSYVGEALLPKGGKMLLGGESKIGKSFLCMELCRALATGTPLYGSARYAVEAPVKTLYVDQELGLAGLRARGGYMLADADAELCEANFHYVSKTPGLHLDTAEGYEMLAALLEEVQPRVLVMDPASRLLDGEDNDNRTVRRFFENIDRLIKAHAARELSVVVAHHYRKPSGVDDLDMDDDDRYSFHHFRGASEWAGAPDTIQTVVRPVRVPGETSWLLGTQYETRHGESGRRLYLRVQPGQPGTVAEVPDYVADGILAEMRATREAAVQERKARKRGGKRDGYTQFNFS